MTTPDDMRIVHSSEIADDPAAFAGDYVPVADVQEALALVREIAETHLSAATNAEAELTALVSTVEQFADLFKAVGVVASEWRTRVDSLNRVRNANTV